MSRSPLQALIGAERKRQGGALKLAALAGVSAAASGAALLGLSGWFIAGAAVAGATGAVAAFNYLLPSAAIRALAIIRTVGRYGERLEGHRAALNALAHIRPALFAGLMQQSPERALSLSTGEAAQHLIGDVDGIESVFVRRSGLWSALGAATVGAGLTALAGWPCSLAFLGAFAAHTAGALAISQRLARIQGGAVQDQTGELKDSLAALLAAAPEIAAYGLADWADMEVGRRGQPLSRSRVALHRAEGWQAGFGALTIGAAMLGVLYLARHSPLPLMAIAGLAAGAGLEGASGLVRGFMDDGVLRRASRRLDGALTAPAPTALPSPQFSTLSFGAPDGDWIDLWVGERLLIDGRSGCGKTSLLERLLRLRTSEGWPVRIGGMAPERLDLAKTRALFAYAPQDAAVIAGTIRENLLLAAPDADDTALWAALRDAALDIKVLDLPRRLDTWVGDAGERLSGGERRRLSLARALLRPAPWLVLDEPTEGLDAETERRVIDRLSTRLQRTRQGLILVSHRPAPRRLCRQVLDLDHAIVGERAA